VVSVARRLWIAALLAAGPAGAMAAPPLWNDLEAGPYAVGFDVVWARDASRRFGAGEGGAPAPARPVRVFVWYPAEPESGRAMRYADYVEVEPEDPAERAWNDRLRAREMRTLRNLAAAIADSDPEVAFARLLDTPVGARRDATAAAGPFPRLLFSLGLNAVQQEDTVLAEWLASHGWIVANVAQVGTDPMRATRGRGLDDIEIQARDVEFALAVLDGRPGTDPAKLAVGGFSNGGTVALLVAMRNREVDAVVGLDSGLQFAWGRPLREHPQYDPSIRTPVLAIHGPERGDDGRGVVLDDLVLADRYRMELTDTLHLDFTDLPALHAARFPGAAPSAGIRSVRQARKVHEAVCRAIRTFLDARVRGDQGAMRSLAELPTASGLAPERVSAWAVRPGASTRTAREWAEEVVSAGPDRAAEAYRAAVEADPSAAIRPDALLGWAYSLAAGERRGDAIVVLRFAVAALPRSVAAAAALGEALDEAGDGAAARAAWRAAEERIGGDPDLDDAARAEWTRKIAERLTRELKERR